MHPDSNKRAPNNPYRAILESMQANQRAIDTQIPCGKSFNESMKELNNG